MKPSHLRAVIVGLVLLACKEQEKPHVYRLSEDKLVNFLFDVQVSESMLQGIPLNKKDSLTYLFWQKMEIVYGLPADTLKDELRKLETDPEKMKTVYDEVKVKTDSIP